MGGFPLNGCDAFMLAMDGSMRSSGGPGNICHLLVTLPSGTDLDRFQELISRHHAYRYVTSLRLSTPWLRGPRWNPTSGDTSPASIASDRECKTTEELARLVVMRSIDPHRQPPFGATLLPSLRSGPSILFHWHHALCDAHGGETLVKLLATPHQDEPASLVPSQLSRPTLRQAVRRAHHTKRLIFEKATPRIARLIAPRPVQRELSYHKVAMTPEQTQAIDAHSRRLTGGMFPTALYLAATARALASISPNPLLPETPLFVPVPHDMRRSTKQRSPLSNQVSVAFFRLEAPLASSLLNVTNSIIEQLHQTIADSHHHGLLDFFGFLRRLPASLAWKIIEYPTRGHPASFYFSDIGGSLSSLSEFHGVPVTYATHYPPLLSPPGFTTVWSRYRGTLEVTVCYDRLTLGKHSLEQFVDNLTRELLQEAA